MQLLNYIHDEEAQMLYAIPREPTITAKQNRNGKTKAWITSIEFEVSSPNNYKKRNKWVIPLKQSIEYEYPFRKKEKEIIPNFIEHFYPEGKKVSYKEYLAIKEDYDERSGVNWDG